MIINIISVAICMGIISIILIRAKYKLLVITNYCHISSPIIKIIIININDIRLLALCVSAHQI